MPLSQKEIDEAARQFLTQGPYAYLKQQVTADYQDPTDPYNDYNAAPSEQTFQKMAQAGDDLKNAIAGGGMGGVTYALDSAGFYLNSLGNYTRGIGKAYNAAIGSDLGMNAVGNVADNAGTWFYDTAGNAEKTAGEYQAKVSDPNNLVYQTLSGSASSIPMMLSSAALSLPLGGMPAMATLMGSSEAAGTAGGLYRRLRAQGMSDQEAKDAANRLFWSEAPLDIASENIFGMFGKLAPKVAPRVAEGMGKIIPSGLLRSVLGEGLQEGAQETYQEWLQNAAEKSAGQPLSGYGSALLEEGKNLPEYMRTQGLPGALSGMLMAGVGGAVSSIRQNRAQTPQEKQTIANVQKVQEAFANAAQAGHVYTAPGATENVGTATAAAPMPSTTGTGFEGVDISKGFSPTTTTTATLPGQLVPQGLSDIANPSQGTISTAGYPLPGVIPTTAPTTPSGKPQQTVTRGNAAQVGQAIATAPQPAAQPTAQTPGDVTRVPVSVRGGTDENGNFVLGSDVGDAIRTLIGINGQQPTQSPQAPAQRPAAPANVSRVVTPDGNTEIETHYAVVPAESLVTSNTPDFGVNQAYPAELQPRDRTRTANQTNVMNITRNLDPARLADSRLTSEGAPIVDANGVVESGNGRTLALMRGYRDGAQTMQGYRQYLLDNAARLGLDPAQVAGVQNPVLVRVRDTQMTPEQRVAFANASNRSSIAGMSATEQARMDAGNLTNDILSQYNIEQPPSSTGQRNFHQAFLATIPENERGQLIDSKGQPTQALIRREQNALVYAATGDEQLAERMTESTDDNVRIVSNAIVQAAPTLARLNSEMRAGNLRGEYGIASDIATAANKLSQLRNEGQKVEDFLGQRHLFSDLELSEEALTLLEAFDKNKRYANRIRDALLNYAHSVEMLGGPNEQNLFGEATPGKIDLLKAAIDRATNGEGTQGTLFNRPEGNRDYAFIGQKGAEAIDNARKVEYGDQKSLLHKLYDAQQMERNGEDKQKIWLATGWDRGIDGHWRYELLDGKLKNDQLIYANREYHLKDLYDMPALYEAYPQIADLVVRFKPLGRTYGQVVTWNSGKKEIWMNSTIMADLKGTRKVKSEALETFVHEIQHVIQDTEGFASGGDEQAARRAYSKWLSEYAEKLNRWERNVWHDETEKIWKYTHLIKQLGRAERVIFNYQTGRITDTSLRGMWEKELADVRKQLDEVHSTLDEYEKRDAKELEEEGSALYGLNGSSAWQKYAALLGESEARYIEQRLAYTVAQRQAQRPSDYSNVKNAGRILDGVKPTPAPLEAPQTVQTPTPAPAPAPNPAPKPAPTTGGFFGGQGTFGFDDGGTQGTLFSRNAPAVQTAKQIAAEVQAVRQQLVDDLKAAGRDEQSAKAEAQIVAAYFGRTANEARKAGMALSVRDQYERFKVEQGIAPQTGENVYEQPERDLTQTQEFKKWFGKSKAVDENGNPQVFYHGTPDGSFDEFRPGAYFTSAKEYADRYQNPSASSISSGKQAVNPKTYAVYLKTEKPFTLSDPKARRIFINEYIKGGNALGINPYLSNQEYAKIKSIDWTEGEDLKDFLQENGYDYDSILLDEGGDPDGSGGVTRRGDSYLVFSPEQIKSVDNRGTFDSSANIYNQPAWHGSPHTFDKFDLGEIGTGEGSQVHGWGLYFSQDKKIAESYKNNLAAEHVTRIKINGTTYTFENGTWRAPNGQEPTGLTNYYLSELQSANGDVTALIRNAQNSLRQYEGSKHPTAIETAKEWRNYIDFFSNNRVEVLKNPGSLFEVDVPENDVLLDEEKELSEQPGKVRRAVRKIVENMTDEQFEDVGEDIHHIGRPNAISHFWRLLSDSSGKQVYGTLSDILGGDREASLALNDNGVKGITYVGGRDGRCFVVFDDKAIRTIERYNQEVAKETPQDYSELRGQISFMDTGEATRQATITLFNADRSTFVHEVGHKMLDDLVHLGQNPDAGAVFKQDLQVAMDWLGVKDASEIGTEQHERFARAFERYLMEGEAPTSKLAEVFEHFKQWLIDIYRNVANLDVELSPEVRDLFDRLLGKETATETRQSATITGPALAGRGAAFQSQTGRDYSMGRDYSTATPTTPTAQNAGDVKRSLTRIDDILNSLRKIRPVRQGVDAPRAVLGYTNRDSQIARHRFANDWRTATHEIGHIVDYKLGLREKVANSALLNQITDELVALGKNTSPANETQEYFRKEGIAEYFRNYAVNPQMAEAMAPEYTKLFREALESEPELKKAVDEIFEIERSYEMMTPEEKLRAGIQKGDETDQPQSVMQSLKNGWEKFRAQFDDALRPLERMQNVLRDRARESGRTGMLQNGELKDDFAVYDMARTTPGSLGKAKRDVEALMAPVRKLGTEAYDSLISYMKAKRALNYWTNGLEPGIDLTQAQTEQFVKQFEAQHPELVKINKQIADAYEQMVRRTMIDAGVWSEAQYQEFKKKWPDYVPFMRVGEDGKIKAPGTAGGKKFVNLSNQVKQTKGVGSEHAFKAIADPFESMFINAMTYNKIAEKNRVGQTLMNAARADPGMFADLIEPVEGGEITKDSFYVWENGKKQYFTADKDILNALRSLEAIAPDNIISKVATKASNALKIGATRANPAFIITNFVRDAMYSAMTNSGWGVPFHNTIKGLTMQLAKDPKMAEKIADAIDHGIAYSGLTELDMNTSRESVARAIKKEIGDASFYAKLANSPFGKFFSGVGSLNEMIELAPKFAEYQRLVDQGYPKRYAARMAREVNLDFSRGGSVGKAANRYIAFFNPAIQGVSKLGRTAAANPGKFLAKTALYVMLPSIISWAMGHDDDEYKRLSRNIKDRYWVFKTPGGTWIRIVKPDLVGLVGSAVERVLDAAADKDPAAFRGLGTSVAEAAFPSYMPTVLGPILEHRSNKSFFYGEQLVPQSLQNLPPEMQYQKHTSSTAKYLGKVFGMSPIVIDNYIKGYGGGVAETIAKAPDLYDQYVSQTGEKKKFSEWPIVSRFTVDPYRSSESINRFYDLKRQTEVAKNGYKTMAKQGERGELTRDVKAAQMFDKAGKRLSELNKDIARIREAKGVSPEKKRERIDRIQLERNRLAERILAQYDKMK